MIQVGLLGDPRVYIGGVEVGLPAEQPLLLLALLASRESWLGRDGLMASFWPDAPLARGRHNPSQVLYRSRRTLWGAALQASPTHLRWSGRSDVGEFRAAISSRGWSRAASLHRGPFLNGVRVPAAPDLAAWLEGERSSLAANWRECCLRAAGELAAEGRGGEALPVLRRLLESDPLAEDEVQSYLRCAVQSGQRDQAWRVFEGFKRRLREELGMAPLAETEALALSLGASGA